jgi:cobalamin-dependent methionine synthase I
MLQTYFSLRGYNVINLSPSMPTRSLISHIEKENPDLVLISITLDKHLVSGKKLVKSIQKIKIPVIVGGQALKNDNFDVGVKTFPTSSSLAEINKVVKTEISQFGN